MPPELMALLQAAQQQEAPSPAGFPGPAPEQAGGDAGPADVLRQILQLCDRYRQVEQDDVDLLEIEKISTQVQALLAAQAREQDDLLQGKASPRALRRNA